jgi:hypothetical protein
MVAQSHFFLMLLLSFAFRVHLNVVDFTYLSIVTRSVSPVDTRLLNARSGNGRTLTFGITFHLNRRLRGR